MRPFLERADTVPALINKYMLPHERQVITVRRHPVILLPPAAVAMGGLFAAVAVGPISVANQALDIAIWTLMGFFVVRFILASVNWLTTYVAITSQRCIITSGLLSVARVRNIPLESVKDMTLMRSRLGHMFGYGSFIFQSGTGRTVINYLPYPVQLYLEVHGLVFRDREDSPD
jgi:hypothetical protein